MIAYAIIASSPICAQVREDAPPRYRGVEIAPQNADGTGQPAATIPDENELLVLIRTSLLTLNDAILTDNFTVLRDRISPTVRAQNTSGRLSQIFSPLTAQRLNLSAVAILSPELTKAPSIDADNRLHVSGFYPGDGIQTNFDLTFEMVRRRWRLYGLSVNISPTNQQEPNKKPSAPASKPEGAASKP